MEGDFTLAAFVYKGVGLPTLLLAKGISTICNLPVAI